MMVKLWISQSHINEIISEVEEYAPFETGGTFFGYVADNDDLVVTDLVPAGGAAKRGLYSFEPDQDFQLNEIERLFYLSKGKTSYLGDWHSHPRSSTALSRKDERTLLKIALSTEAQCEKPIMMVIGSYPEKWCINCVQFESGCKLIWPFYSCNYHLLNLVID